MINKFDKERFDAMGRDAMSRVEEIVNATKLNDLLHRKEEEDKKKNTAFSGCWPSSARSLP